MKREPVESESVAEIGYEATSEILEVLFRNGRLYQYLEVPERIFDELIKAESIGRFINLRIKPAYRYREVR